LADKFSDKYSDCISFFSAYQATNFSTSVSAKYIAICFTITSALAPTSVTTIYSTITFPNSCSPFVPVSKPIAHSDVAAIKYSNSIAV
jgi:hypothetical protein